MKDKHGNIACIGSTALPSAEVLPSLRNQPSENIFGQTGRRKILHKKKKNYSENVQKELLSKMSHWFILTSILQAKHPKRLRHMTGELLHLTEFCISDPSNRSSRNSLSKIRIKSAGHNEAKYLVSIFVFLSFLAYHVEGCVMTLG